MEAAAAPPHPAAARRSPVLSGLTLGAAASVVVVAAAAASGTPAPPATAWTPLPYASVPRLRLRLTADATVFLYVAQMGVGAVLGGGGGGGDARVALLVASAVTHVAHLGAIAGARLLSKAVLVNVLVTSGDHPLGNATGSPWWAPLVDGPQSALRTWRWGRCPACGFPRLSAPAKRRGGSGPIPRRFCRVAVVARGTARGEGAAPPVLFREPLAL